VKGVFRVTYVRPVRLEWRCGCHGNMVYTGSHAHAFGSEHGHKCDKCGIYQWSRHRYPRIEYRESGEGVGFEPALEHPPAPTPDPSKPIP
jgi:hypothetical protein